MAKIEDCAFLSYIANPYAPGDIYFCALSAVGREPKEISLCDMMSFPHRIVTYDLTLLTAILKDHDLPLPANIIDVEQAGRLIIGHSHNEYTGQLPWTIWELLEDYFHDKTQLTHIRNWYYRSEPLPDKSIIMASLFEINRILPGLWNKQLLDLELKGELHRFINIEIPINAILLERQYKGIKIDTDKLNDRLDVLDNVIAQSTHVLRTKWGIIDPIDTEAISRSAAYSGYVHLSSVVEESDNDETIEVSANWEEIVQVYDKLKKAKRDKNILLRFGVIGETRIYPVFEGIGTVTGRVLVKNPAIQQLKKSSRDIIIADDKYTLLYPDFRQFEPGILADDSGDQSLTAIYNSGDVYNALSLALFNDEKYRKEAKLIFLAFSYGMTKERLPVLINDLTSEKLNNSQLLVEKFFGQFSAIEKWKEALCCELSATGRIGTRDGNYRYRKNMLRNELADVEKRWVISQRIQGTASLIFKRCMLRINQELPDVQFLVPMHDAILYQIPSEALEITKEKIECIFIDEYRQECRSIMPRVSFEPFWVDD